MLGPICCGDAFDEDGCDVAMRIGPVRKEWSRGDEAVWQCRVASGHLSDRKTRTWMLEGLEAERELLDEVSLVYILRTTVGVLMLLRGEV